jgi:hypothetical protein
VAAPQPSQPQRRLSAIMAGTGTGAASDAIVAENRLPGSPSSEWDINGAGDPTIQGFATRMSVEAGETLDFKVDTDAPAYRIDIYRLGYYNGMGARKVACVQPPASLLPQGQPPPLRDERIGLVDCGNWAVSASWKVPATAISGVYIGRLVRPEPSAVWRADHTQASGSAWMTGSTATSEPSAADPQQQRLEAHEIDDEVQPQPGRDGWRHSYGANGQSGALRNPLREPRASHIYFVVRQPSTSAGADVVFQTCDTTWHAYNTYGGACMYGGFGSRWCSPGSPPRTYVASYNRPLVTRDYRSINCVFGAEYPLLRFLERNGYGVAYQAGTDTHVRGVPANARIFVSVGHDEYWSGAQRANVEAARGRGVSLAFFSGNEMYSRPLSRSSAAVVAAALRVGIFLQGRVDAVLICVVLG